MIGMSATQIGILGLIAVTVIKEAFAFARYRKNGKNGKYVSEPFCDERTKRIEASIQSSNALVSEKLHSLTESLKARPCLNEKECNK